MRTTIFRLGLFVLLTVPAMAAAGGADYGVRAGLIQSAAPSPASHLSKHSDRYFGQVPPGDVPAVFAPGVISKKDRYEQFLSFSPDGHEITFGLTNDDWSAFTLYTMKQRRGRWGDAVVAPFQGRDSTALTACRSYTSSRVFFTASRPTYPPCDIWTSALSNAGWSEPTKVGPPISSDADEFEVAISRNGTLYFSSTRPDGNGDMDIYRAESVDGGYPTAENLGPPVNSSAGDDLPCVAPDESYLIFASNRPGGLGERDLYISFRMNGRWTNPQNLGAPINTEHWDIYPSISPDGKYLFFTRRKAWKTDEDSDIYWVSTSFIERWRASAVER